jgi:GTP-binding protein
MSDTLSIERCSKIRNICIIAHVDHGKTTLIDHILRQTGLFADHQRLEERVLDSGDLEKEKGITIKAKNASFNYKDYKINIMDTPGHADFGGEVERVLGMADGAILLVDAVEGALPQTRFVLSKAISHGHRILVVLNKIDRRDLIGTNRVAETLDQIFSLFIDLGASEQQSEFPVLYACAKFGMVSNSQEQVMEWLKNEEKGHLNDLLDQIVAEVPPPEVEYLPYFKMLVSNLDFSEYVGDISIGRILSGGVKKNDRIFRLGINDKGDAVVESFVATRLYQFSGLLQTEAQEIFAGDIGLIAGCESFAIGDTLTSDKTIQPEPRLQVEQPTLRMLFAVNNSPFSGRDGEAIQSRKLRDRLEKECRKNVAIKLEDGPSGEYYYVLGRGELQFAILIEELRREGLEFLVGRPQVLFKTIDGVEMEPFENCFLDLPQDFSSDVTQLMQERKGVLIRYENLPASDGSWVRLTFEIPTRGLLGIRTQFLTTTKGQGLYSSEIVGYRAKLGTFLHRSNGSLVADRTGKTTEYALFSLQERGQLFVSPGVEVYEGMIIGEHARENDLNVNAVREKKLTNIRTTSSDGLSILHGTRKMSLEQSIEYMDDDEWIEVTPKSIRLRKKNLGAGQRSVVRE